MFDLDTGYICPKKLKPDSEPYGISRDMTGCGYLGLVLVWCRLIGSCARLLAILLVNQPHIFTDG